MSRGHVGRVSRLLSNSTCSRTRCGALSRDSAYIVGMVRWKDTTCGKSKVRVANAFNAGAGFEGLDGSVAVPLRRALVSIGRCRSYDLLMLFEHLGLGGE